MYYSRFFFFISRTFKTPTLKGFPIFQPTFHGSCGSLLGNTSSAVHKHDKHLINCRRKGSCAVLRPWSILCGLDSYNARQVLLNMWKVIHRWWFREIRRSPVEGKVVEIPNDLPRFILIPGWWYSRIASINVEHLNRTVMVFGLQEIRRKIHFARVILK